MSIPIRLLAPEPAPQRVTAITHVTVGLHWQHGTGPVVDTDRGRVTLTSFTLELDYRDSDRPDVVVVRDIIEGNFHKQDDTPGAREADHIQES